MNIKKKAVGLKNNIKKHGFIFYHNIIVDPMLGIGYITVRWISCINYVCLRDLDYPWNSRQDKYNKFWYKGENKKCVYWPILGSYNNLQIIHCIDMIKQHETTNTDINVYIKHNATRNIAFKNWKRYLWQLLWRNY